MDELIEGLWNRKLDLTPMDFTEFKQAIQTACAVQRDACVREFRRYSKVNEYEISENWARAISMSKIERQDYENN